MYSHIRERISTHSLTKRLTLTQLLSRLEQVHFNSQPHEEADGCFRHPPKRKRYFNSQPHEEADPGNPCLHKFPEISTHSLTKRLTISRLLFGVFGSYFNSQPHEEADKGQGWRKPITVSISTHSLTKRLTYWTRCCYPQSDISTHSLTKRLTAHHILEEHQRGHFNSQPHEEADCFLHYGAR